MTKYEVKLLIRVYVVLLKHPSHLLSELKAEVRDTIAKYTGISPREVQLTCEDGKSYELTS